MRSPSLNRRVLSFCEAIDRSEWRGDYQLELRCDAVTALSDEALRCLANTGCRQINMGIEKGHDAQLLQLRKRLSTDVAREASERINALGLRAAGTFIIGGIDETPEMVDETIDFAVSLPLDYAQFNPLAVYPGTHLFKQAFPDQPVDDWLTLCLNDELAPFGDILFRNAALSLELILDSVERGYREFYTDRRLARVLDKLPPSERDAASRSYGVLLEDRARSWSSARRSHSDRDDVRSFVGPC